MEYRKILEHYFNGMSQRTIQVVVNSSRNTIREIVNRAKMRALSELTDEMTDQWLEEFLFPEKLPESEYCGRFLPVVRFFLPLFAGRFTNVCGIVYQ